MVTLRPVEQFPNPGVAQTKPGSGPATYRAARHCRRDIRISCLIIANITEQQHLRRALGHSMAREMNGQRMLAGQ